MCAFIGVSLYSRPFLRSSPLGSILLFVGLNPSFYSILIIASHGPNGYHFSYINSVPTAWFPAARWLVVASLLTKRLF